METTRQQKIAKQIQRDMAEIFQKEGPKSYGSARDGNRRAGFARFFIRQDLRQRLSFEQNAAVMATLEQHNWFLRRALGQRIRNQLKTVPEIQFFLDDSLEYIEQIDRAMHREE